LQTLYRIKKDITMNDIAIKVENLSKRYRIGLQEKMHNTLFATLSSWAKSPLSNFKDLRKLTSFNEEDGEDIIWAIKNISFDVRAGEVVGIIGKNGSGKSTLLKILSEITDPTSGRAMINGRVSSLLEVGTGFHPELTGRENIYLNGTILGMTKHEVDTKFDEIVDFSGIEKFIDTPAKRYSSGMRVRLAFAVAAHLEPEILLVDEVLSVGDAEFQQKCLDKMSEVTTSGRTVLYVSHNMPSIEALCHRALLLEKGQLTFSGTAAETVSHYLGKKILSSQSHTDLSDHPHREAKTSSLLKSLKLLNSRNEGTNSFKQGENIIFELELSARNHILKTPDILISILDNTERIICQFSSEFMSDETFDIVDKKNLQCLWNACPLKPGTYSIELIVKKFGKKLDHITDVTAFEITHGDFYHNEKLGEIKGSFLPGGKWKLNLPV